MADIGHEETDALLDKLIDEIYAIYEQAAYEMKVKAETYLDWFKDMDKKMRGKLQNGEITNDVYKQWRMSHLLTADRFLDMADILATDMNHTNEIAANIINGYLPEVYAINHNYATYQIEQQSRFDTSYTLYDHQTVERLIKDKLSGNPKQLLVPWEAVVKYPAAERWNAQIVNSVAAQGILQGKTIPEIARNIGQTLPTRNYTAAVRDARTMITSAENAGRIDAYDRAQDMGIKLKKQWMATLDNRTRHSHRLLDGETRDVDDTFSNGCEYPGDPKGDPAEVYNCFIGETKIASDSEIIRSYKHKYDGELISIKTASGVSFTCTPNHPILTARGWIAAKLLKQGDNLLVALGSNREFMRRNPNINHAFPRMDTFHELFCKLGRKRTRTLGVNFHGDIPAADVEIITQKRFLRNIRNTSSRDGVNEFLLKCANKAFMSKCSFVKHFRRILSSTLGYIRSMSQLLTVSLRDLRHSQIHRLRPIALLYANRVKPLNDYLPRDAELFRKSLDGFTGAIFSDNIVNIDKNPGSTHVYNLQTQNGYYFVNSSLPKKGVLGMSELINNSVFAIAHNCRCTLISQIEGFEFEQAKTSPKLGNQTYEEWKGEHAK